MRSSATVVVPKHKSFLDGVLAQPCITSVLQKAAFKDKVMKSELSFARFVAEHNLSVALADHFTKLCKCMFPDSKIADAFSYARTKMTALIAHALGPAAENTVVVACRMQPFTILCDGGNDNLEVFRCHGEAVG